jgi:hypothetical protein
MDSVADFFIDLGNNNHELYDENINKLVNNLSYTEAKNGKFETFEDLENHCQDIYGNCKTTTEDMPFIYGLSKFLCIDSMEGINYEILLESTKYLSLGADRNHEGCKIILAIQLKLFYNSNYTVKLILDTCYGSKTASLLSHTPDKYSEILRDFYFSRNLYFVFEICKIINNPEECVKKCFLDVEKNIYHYNKEKYFTNIIKLNDLYNFNCIKLMNIYFDYIKEYDELCLQEYIIRYSICDNSSRLYINERFANLIKKHQN